MKEAKVVYIHKPENTDWGAPKFYRAISLLSTLGKMAEKAVADHLSLNGDGSTRANVDHGLGVQP